MRLYELFQLCLTAPYEQVGPTANYAALREGSTLYLLFEGSDGKGDWQRNLDFPAKPYRRQEGGLWFCHRGFLRVWKDLEPTLDPMLRDGSIRRVVAAGYSHGAALAVLCHEYVWFHRPELRPQQEGWGFGCPRVVWGRILPQLRQRWERFTVVRNLDDLVTHLPPAVLGYRHVGKLLEIGKRGRYSPIQAHFPDNYLRELQSRNDD